MIYIYIAFLMHSHPHTSAHAHAHILIKHDVHIYRHEGWWCKRWDTDCFHPVIARLHRLFSNIPLYIYCFVLDHWCFRCSLFIQRTLIVPNLIINHSYFKACDSNGIFRPIARKRASWMLCKFKMSSIWQTIIFSRYCTTTLILNCINPNISMPVLLMEVWIS